MARLPLVETENCELKEWLEPGELCEIIRQQPRFVRPDLSSLRTTMLCTVAPALYFLRRILPRVKDAGEAFHENQSCVVSAFWALLSLLALTAASCRNPGVVPRSACDTSGPVAAAATSATVPARWVIVNDVQVKQRWCTSCKVYRPLRSKHCSYCDRCIFRFDHHCTWLGNCVGLGNYRSFLVLVIAATGFFGHSALIALKVLRQCLDTEHGSWQALKSLLSVNCGRTLYLTYAAVMWLAFAVLLLYHAVIIAINLTTNEHIRDYYLDKNPFRPRLCSQLQASSVLAVRTASEKQAVGGC
eukprot:TRINITY_DN92002_c0_g1_i1.p1 TRINITY_DN92002_c0_g1~~TRINITY_DN92002_c0_g1_i1.p1  ORF type:complete len:315 (+),score=36.65 TRINITY_DN92002_c0_g1_i1:44-946(+)